MTRCTRSLPAVALALFLAALTSAVAQEPPPFVRPSVSMYALRYLSDPTLQKELKLTDAQVKKLDEQRNKYGMSGLVLPRDEAQRDELTKSIDKAFADVLEPAQVKRLRQVILQQLARSSTRTPPVLANMPDVLKELKLNDDQKAKLGPRIALVDVLTDEQKKVWKEITGEPFETPLRATTLGGPGGFLAASPPSLRYLTQKAVVDELKLSEAQTKKIADLNEKWQRESPTFPRTEEERKKVETLTTAAEKEVAAILDATQAKRLKQIVLQQSLANRPETAVFLLADVVKELNLSDTQVTKIKSLDEERRKALSSLFLTGEKYEAVEKNVDTQEKKTYELLLAVLNDNQQSHLKEMLGEPFKGQLTRGGPGGFSQGGSGGPGGRAAYSTYLSITALAFVSSKPLQEELKLSEEQVKRLNDLSQKSLTTTLELGPPGARVSMEEWDKKHAQQAKDNEKSLAEILTPKQLARFKQLLLQYYAANHTTSPSTSSILGRLVEVSEELKLTKEQKEQLQQRKEIAKVLDEKQQAKWKEMLGEPLEKVASLSTRPSGPGGPGGPPGRILSNSLLSYLGEKSVQEDLKLTADQIKKLPELTQKWGDLTKERAQWRRGDEYNKKMAEAREALEKAIAGVLDAKQVTRLHQIELQQTQRFGLDSLLTTPRVQKDLGLSEEQIKGLLEVSSDTAKTENLLRRELTGAVGQGRNEDYIKTLEEFNKITEKKLNSVLTAKQREELKALLGEPFKGEFRGGFPGGGGGFPG